MSSSEQKFKEERSQEWYLPMTRVWILLLQITSSLGQCKSDS
jgi:hypothetical protein